MQSFLDLGMRDFDAEFILFKFFSFVSKSCSSICKAHNPFTCSLNCWLSKTHPFTVVKVDCYYGNIILLIGTTCILNNNFNISYIIVII